MHGLEILERSCASQIEEVRAHAKVTSATTLALRDVSETMLDADTSPEARTTDGCSDQFPQSLLELFVSGGAHGAPAASCGHGAIVA